MEYTVYSYAGYKATVHYEVGSQEFIYDPIKKEYEPVKAVFQSVKPVFQSVKPVNKAVKPLYAPVKPVYNTVSPIKKQSTTNFSQCHF